MTRKEIETIVTQELKKMTKKVFSLKDKILNLNIDSLDLVELINQLEEKLEIAITDEELMSIETVEDVVNIVEGKL